jgi:hypothetical protein
MTCLSAADIARVATVGASDPHVADCITCRRSLDADRALRSRLLSLPVQRLTETKRREIAAALVAVVMPGSRRRAGLYAVAAVAAATAMIATALGWAHATRQPVATAAIAPDLPVAELAFETRARFAANEDAASFRPPALIAGGTGARFTRHVGFERDQVALDDGTILVDTRATRGLDIRVGDEVVRCDNARVAVRASHSAIVSIQPVFGAAAVVSHGRKVLVESTPLRLQDEPPAARPELRSLSTFRQAWLSLRDGHNHEAIALFDASTDTAVAEEALYWSAIASKRAGDDAGASERLQRLAQRFPDSPYASQVRALLAKP